MESPLFFPETSMPRKLYLPTVAKNIFDIVSYA